MKKTLIALAAVAVSSAAFAQATISGSAHVGIMDTGAAGASAAVSTLGGGMNAINIVTSEDLGGGLTAGFTSQLRFNAASGDITSAAGGGTALFHAANVHVGGGFGTVRIGKIAEAGVCAFDPWACGGGAALQAGVGVSALAASGTQAHSVSYATPRFSGFNASYQTSVSPRSNERQLLSLNYSEGPIAAAFVRANNGAISGGSTTTLNDTPALVVTNPALVTNDVKSSQQALAGSYDFGMAKVSLVNTVTKNAAGTKTADVLSLGVAAPMGAATILAGYNKDKEAAANADTKISLGVNYSLSKRTTLGADIFRAEAAGSSTGYVARVRHTF